MKYENVDFREALQILADKAGITLPKKRLFHENELSEKEGTEISRTKLFQAADWVAKNYHEALLHSGEAAIAREYLHNRKISAEAIRKFRIGYAPLDRNWLADKVNKPEQIRILEIVGNFQQKISDSLVSPASVSHYDFFRGRLIFPIRDEQGRTVAFGGRLIPHSPLSEDHWHKERKYLNSRETQLFSKHKVLYGLDTAKQYIKETRRALIMEGYTDCIKAHEFGFGEAVAVLGTALGPAHIRLLTRMGAEKIILMFDGDRAGQKKTESDQVLIDFIAQGADMAVLTLPEGLDPCDFLEQYGSDAVNTLLETETVDALEHVFRAKTRGIDLKNDIIASSKSLHAILGIIAHAPVKGTSPDDPIRFRIEKTVQHLAVRFSMPEEQIRRRLKEKQQKAADRPVMPDEPAEQPVSVVRRWSKEELPDMLERNMLELWIMDPTAVYAFWEHIFPEQLRSPVTQSIYNQCSELVEQHDKPPTFDNLMTAFDDPQMKNYLIELETSGRKKFFADEEDEIDPVLKANLIEEIISEFSRRESERKHRDKLNELRRTELSEDEKTQQLLELLQTLRGSP